jgi:predicted ribosome quality control (RQC) complex YloA/Tae2 family protein
MDYLSLKAAANAVKDSMLGSRLADVRPLDHYEILLRFQRGRELVLSIDPDRPGIYLFTADGILPSIQPGPFPAALKSHLAGTVLTGLSFPFPGDRVLRMVFQSGWPRKQGTENILILEVMGRYSNLILLDHQERIIAPMKPVPPSKSRVRPLIPGKKWSPPPQREGTPIDTTRPEDLSGLPDQLTEGALVGMVRGLSPATARIALKMARRDLRPVAEILSDLVRSSDGSRGAIIVEDGRRILIPFDMGPLDGIVSENFSDFPSAALSWRGSKGHEGSGGVRDDDLESGLAREVGRIQRELSAVDREVERCLDHKTVRLKAETLLAHLSRVKRGDRRIELPHPYRSGETLIIEMNPAVSGSVNAQALFAEAKRMRRGLEELRDRRDSLLRTIRNLGEALSALRAGDPEPAREALLRNIGNGKAKGSRTGGPKRGPGRRYEKDGFIILVGKSAVDNERVTFKAAGPHDLWIHTRDYAGSHVVILTEKRDVPEDVVRYAASLAPQSSQAKGDPAVEVMVTERKWVRKLKGGRPGQVRVERYRSVIAKPDKR